MSHRKQTSYCLTATLLVLSLYAHASAETKKPLKVYILAGQSNMEGAARVTTFDYIGDDPATVPLLKSMRGADGKPRICDRTWISYYSGWHGLGEGFGKLTSGYGAREVCDKDCGRIGPEYTFGITMEDSVEQPVLIIKAAWGGKSLHTDFRSPSAGPFVYSESQMEYLKKRQGNTAEEIQAEKDKVTGRYYQLMIKHVKYVLGDIKRVIPSYDEKQGYEISGFVWFQGHNDKGDGSVYPHSLGEKRFDKYSEFMAHFIRDVRKDLSTPKMPFVIGVYGGDGMTDKNAVFRKAMAAPASMPEFKGNVAAVETAVFWDERLATVFEKQRSFEMMKRHLAKKHKRYPNEDGKMTPKQQKAYLAEFKAKTISPADRALMRRAVSDGGYHYFGSAKFFAQAGQAFAKAILEMESQHEK